jgi:DNA integrity scanning protein DisA with diadenylate cyclase activity
MAAGDWLQLAALVVIVAAAWRVTRGGGGAAVQELSTANRVLERRNHELGSEVRDLRIEVAELRTRTDFAAAMAAYEERMDEARRGDAARAQQQYEEHEARAAARSDNVVRVLELIAARLGPDDNGDTSS